MKQLSVFIENREGRLEDVLNLLKEENINIISLSLADTSDYGMLRLIVSDPQKGREALKESLNVEYMYALCTKTDEAAIVIKPSDPKKAEEVLRAAGVHFFAL